jgi:hypothetical protein
MFLLLPWRLWKMMGDAVATGRTLVTAILGAQKALLMDVEGEPDFSSPRPLRISERSGLLDTFFHSVSYRPSSPTL